MANERETGPKVREINVKLFEGVWNFRVFCGCLFVIWLTAWCSSGSLVPTVGAAESRMHGVRAW